MTLETTSLQTRAGTPPYPWWFTPAVLIFVPVALSMATWALVVAAGVPRRFSPEVAAQLLGFDVPAAAKLPGVLLLGAFYCFAALMAMVGWELGSAPQRDDTIGSVEEPAFSERRYFFLILSVATVGVGYCYYTVASRRSVIGALTSQSANQLYDSLPQNAGIQTLRYACILSAPLGVYLWRTKVIGVAPMAFAAALLGLNALLSSRLSLLMAAVVYVAIRVRTREPALPDPARRRRNLLVVVACAVVGFAILTALNYTRNANYFRQYGATNAVEMNLFQTSQYLSVPAQVSLGVSDAVVAGRWHVPSDPVSAFNAVKPTFLKAKTVRKSDLKKYSAYYGYSVRLAPQFLTNSVFADVYADYGSWGWFYFFPLCGAAGYLMARLMQARPVVSATGGVIAYCFAEVWRIQIFSFGFVIFLLLLTVGAAWLSASDPGQEVDGRPARLR